MDDKFELMAGHAKLQKNDPELCWITPWSKFQKQYKTSKWYICRCGYRLSGLELKSVIVEPKCPGSGSCIRHVTSIMKLLKKKGRK